jgi:hypothetical protein
MKDSQGQSFRVQALLSFQRALWEMVTPELRGIAATLTAPEIRARFIYEMLPSDVETQVVAEVEASVLADFDESVDVQFGAVRVVPPTPIQLVEGEQWIYLRRENGPSQDTVGGRT